MEIKVITFNIHHGRGTDGKLDLHRIKRILEESEADLIGLNEVDCHFSRRSDYLDQGAWLAQHLHMHYAYGPAITRRSKGGAEPRQYGNAFLSRYPILSQQNHLFDFYPGVTECRALLEITLQFHHQPLKAYVTHLSLNRLYHKRQTDFIVDRIKDESLPTIVMGDWNMKPGAKGWRTITRHLTDVCKPLEGSPAYTFPSYRPRSQLDYIFVSGHFHIASAHVFKKIPSASDHLPLAATLALKDYL